MLGLPSPNRGTDLPGWFAISLPNFNQYGQGTTAAKALHALGPAAEPQLLAEPEPASEPEPAAKPQPASEPELVAKPQPAATSEPKQSTHSLGRFSPWCPSERPPGPGPWGLGYPALTWVLTFLGGVGSHLLPNFNLNGQGTMAAEAPLAFGLAAVHLGDVYDLI